MAIHTLTSDGCTKRQEQFVGCLKEHRLGGAIFFDRSRIHRLTGFWGPSAHQAALLIGSDGSTLLVTSHAPTSEVMIKDVISVTLSKQGTLIDDQIEVVLEKLAPSLERMRSVGTDLQIPVALSNKEISKNISQLIRSQHRQKLPDEVQLIRAGVQACEACYALAHRMIMPGMSELHLYRHLLAEATESVGEPVGEFGNDFQAGADGGPPRDRPMQSGETLPLDLSVVVRGYRSDLCRTYCVGGVPSEAQQDGFQKVREVLKWVEDRLAPGISCRELYNDVFGKLDGYRGWRFPHHLGHGIGTFIHESPRLNPAWDDVLQIGDVFTVEPGLYGDELRGGIRLEENYWITTTGVQRLSSYPLQL